MAKTIVRLDETDIDLENDKLHQELMAGLLIATLMMTDKRKEDSPLDEKDFAMLKIKKSIAAFLNGLTERGYVITKQEEIPSAFYNA